jgi:hypothetical protein
MADIKILQGQFEEAAKKYPGLRAHYRTAVKGRLGPSIYLPVGQKPYLPVGSRSAQRSKRKRLSFLAFSEQVMFTEVGYGRSL